MTIPEFSIKRRITVFMVILIVTIFGVIAFSRLGLDMLPELEYPVVSVITTYSGVSSEDVEKLITRPVESVISTVKNVKRVNSTSQEGISAVIVEFEWGTKLDFAAQDVREKLSWVTDYLPKDADTPLVIKFNMSDYPILYYGVTGMRDTQVLRKYLDDSVRPRLERLEGVASVYVLGGLEREINVSVDRDKLNAYSVSLDQVIGKLALENVNVSGGHVKDGHTEYLVRTMGEYRDTATMMNTIVAMQGMTPVYLRDVAQVKDAFKEVRNISRTNHRPSVAMMVMKQSGANTVKVVESVNRTLEELRGQMPPDIRLYAAIDQGKIISQVTRSTRNDAIVVIENTFRHLHEEGKDRIMAAMLGVVPTKYRSEGDEYDIRVRFREFDRRSVEDVRNIRIASPTGQFISLYQIADIVQKLGPVKITRENQDRKVTVKANTFGRDTRSIVADIKKAAAGIKIPEGYFVEYGGTYKDMQEAFESLAYALAIAIVLIYMVMAASFESLGHPLVIMLTVPLSFIGVALGLLFFGKTLSVPAFMGFIMLCGVVVRNGIVMIDYINRLRRQGVTAFEAIIQGAVVRLRPILITSLTSTLGALPMALSRTQGSEMRSPMAIALAFGLLFATFLTLFVVPVVYSLFDRIREQ
ncbi:MAG: efflux RND transporter permease subunit [Proteobacteria bacterium]|nr:efflux RND transporter permease subunit [Pseudomonadota bacterium]